MITGETTATVPNPSFRTWYGAIYGFMGDIRVHTKDSLKYAATALQDDTIKVPEDLQDRFGARTRVRVYEILPSTYRMTIDAGPLRMTRHAVTVRDSADPESDSALVAASVQRRVPLLTYLHEKKSGWLPSMSDFEVPPHIVSDPEELQGYFSLIQAAAQQAEGSNHPRDLYLDQTNPPGAQD